MRHLSATGLETGSDPPCLQGWESFPDKLVPSSRGVRKGNPDTEVEKLRCQVSSGCGYSCFFPNKLHVYVHFNVIWQVVQNLSGEQVDQSQPREGRTSADEQWEHACTSFFVEVNLFELFPQRKPEGTRWVTVL
jgi:hypothetical protein